MGGDYQIGLQLGGHLPYPIAITLLLLHHEMCTRVRMQHVITEISEYLAQMSLKVKWNFAQGWNGVEYAVYQGVGRDLLRCYAVS